MNLFTSTVGRKILMAVTGLMLVCFITVHLLGNLSVFWGADAINAYAKHLHDLGPLVWIFRLVMLGLFAIHITFGVQLYLENKAANPEDYAVQKTLVTTFSAKTMVFTGLIILAFLIYHLLHFTVQVTNPEISAQNMPLVQGHLDVFSMVVLSFQKVFIAVIYFIAMIALFLHLSHGLQSWVQTFGLSTGPSQDKVTAIGKIVAIVYGLAYIAIPLFILARIVK
ncbi:MAG: succinate dehydrogenase cytochrome b subunit [Deltaproteobacteria bacterium]|jgi:succinate dehydrogenase / fumarate reductase cytochrome b subunit|nr:succinate dehydrogenase cytochrome b subunit [Deltaproteobacteria bacterium]MCW8893013.1 succinate dehydrogenase cytochrome b subunit [Deltaproteobacteria bacterium]MCW9049804.1 succinate dehydrogenase cytochrome b subunit [Deltaproteobacteria bacterium]